MRVRPSRHLPAGGPYLQLVREAVQEPSRHVPVREAVQEPSGHVPAGGLELQLVREVVQDYVEGLADPAVDAVELRGVPCSASLRERRAQYVWVGMDASGSYTLEADSAAPCPLSDLQAAAVAGPLTCAVCGTELCDQNGAFVVRCYPRRAAGDAPEADKPRQMCRESYAVDLCCMRGLLGKPPISGRHVRRLRKSMAGALGSSRRFAPREWLAPLSRLQPAESSRFRAALSGELARIVRHHARPLAAWRQMERECGTLRDVAVRTRARAVQAVEPRGYEEEEEFDGEEEEKDEEDVAATPVASLLAAPPAFPTGAQPVQPHELQARRCVKTGKRHPPYVLVVPSYGRPERLKSNTLAFLRRQGVPLQHVQVWLAPGCAPGQTVTEEERYRDALAADWPEITFHIGVKGIMEQRWHIGLSHPEGTHIVSFDDDVPEVYYKVRSGRCADTLRPLPPGALEPIIHHAYELMIQERAHLWGLCPSSNPMNMAVNRISRKNGMVNGFAYGYLNRHDEAFRSVYCSPTEDVERSCRTYAKDEIVLRYMMYCARTVFKAPDGISLLYNSQEERKAAEENAIVAIANEFPLLMSVRTGSNRRVTASAMNFQFRKVGLPPLDSYGNQAQTDKAERSHGRTTSVKERVVEARTAAMEMRVLGRCLALQDHLAQVDARPRPAQQDALLAKQSSSEKAVGELTRIVTRGCYVRDDGDEDDWQTTTAPADDGGASEFEDDISADHIFIPSGDESQSRSATVRCSSRSASAASSSSSSSSSSLERRRLRAGFRANRLSRRPPIAVDSSDGEGPPICSMQKLQDRKMVPSLPSSRSLQAAAVFSSQVPAERAHRLTVNGLLPESGAPPRKVPRLRPQEVRGTQKDPGLLPEESGAQTQDYFFVRGRSFEVPAGLLRSLHP